MKLPKYTLIEYMIAFGIIAIAGIFVLRIIYAKQIYAWEQSLGPGRYFVTVPLAGLLVFSWWRRSERAAAKLDRPVIGRGTWFFVAISFGVVLVSFLLKAIL